VQNERGATLVSQATKLHFAYESKAWGETAATVEFRVGAVSAQPNSRNRFQPII
jgi:hypothetical protein